MSDLQSMFQTLLKETNKENAYNNNRPERVQPKNQPIVISKKTPSALVRLVPLEKGTPFVAPYQQIFLSYTTKEGTNKVTPLTFSSSDEGNANDPFYHLLKRIISYNYKFGDQDKDVIALQSDSHYGHVRFNKGNLGMAVRVVQQPNGQIGMEVDQQGYPVFRQMEVKTSVLGVILPEIQGNSGIPTPPRLDGTPFPSIKEGTGWGFIDTQDSFPFQITLGSDNKYSTQTRYDLHLGALPTDYLAKGADGKYLHMDNLEDFIKPTKEAYQGFYYFMYKTINERAKAVENLADPDELVESMNPENEGGVQPTGFTPVQQQAPTQVATPTPTPTPAQPYVAQQVQQPVYNTQPVAPQNTYGKQQPVAPSDEINIPDDSLDNLLAQQPVQPQAPTPVAPMPTQAQGVVPPVQAQPVQPVQSAPTQSSDILNGKSMDDILASLDF